MASEPEKIAWLSAHFTYEVGMLLFSLGKIRKLPPGEDWNAYYESFAVHARNLYVFLTNEERGNSKANEYVAGFEAVKTSQTVSLFQKMRAQVFHPGKNRSEEAGEKVNVEQATAIARWIGAALDDFLERLKGTPYMKESAQRKPVPGFLPPQQTTSTLGSFTIASSIQVAKRLRAE